MAAASDRIRSNALSPRLEFEHKQLLDLGKFFYDGLFKFASISFVLNGVLLSALTFVLKDLANPSKDIFLVGVRIIGGIGIVYNLGVGFACFSLARTAWNLTERFRTVDRQLGLHVAECKSHSDIPGIAGWAFTSFFMILWICVWALLVIYSPELLHAVACFK